MKIRIKSDLPGKKFWIEIRWLYFFWMPVFESHSSHIKYFATQSQAEAHVVTRILGTPEKIVLEYSSPEKKLWKSS